jgi:transcriptional regulator with GAF, ATPase, and Fis domain
MGPRATGPFIVFDCTSVPPNLVESELFGHERGAFTGAIGTRRGVFEQADGGTLLIDEIGDLDLALQPKLLRAVERGEVRRVGGDRTIKFNVRLLAATRRDLDQEVAAGRFRDDLFHRLAVARIELPPLRRRRGDVPLLAHHFWMGMGGREQDLPFDLVKRWDVDLWPGNVRELRNAVSRRLALGDLASSLASKAPKGDAIAEALALDLPLAQARERVVQELERQYVERVLAKFGGDSAKAAAASGIARRYFNVLRARVLK